MTTTNIDKIFEQIGELGTQQIKYLSAIFLIGGYASFHMIQYAFVAHEIDFKCENLESNICPTSAENCTFAFPDKQSTIISEWNLICSKSDLGPASLSVFMFGILIGAMVIGNLADLYNIGRKTCIISTLFGATLATMISAAAPTLKMYLTFRFICGFFKSGFILSIFVLVNELVGPTKRGVVGLAFQTTFALGIAILSYLAYFIRHWRTLTFFIAFLGFPILGLCFLIPESPRWLLNQGRVDEAEKILSDIAIGNGNKLRVKLNKNIGLKMKNSKTDSMKKLFKTEPYIILVQIFSWLTNSLVYYGLTLGASEDLSSNIYVSTAISGIVEIPAYILSIIFLSRMGRKPAIVIFMTIGGFFSIFGWLSESDVAFWTMNAHKLCISASFALIYIHSGEIFPTSVRSSSMGILSMSARIGGIMTPFLKNFKKERLLIVGVLSVVSGLLNATLPETKGKRLPDTIDEMRVHYEYLPQDENPA